MNRYKKALRDVKVDNRTYCIDYCSNKCNAIEKREKHENGLIVLQELVEKAIPKKAIYGNYDEDGVACSAKCPTCDFEFPFGHWNEAENHHCYCGQLMDWEGY